MNNKNYNNLPKQNKIDVSLLVIIIFLSLIGITFVYSASNVVGLDKYGDSFYFFKRQSIFLIISYIFMFLIIKFDLKKIEKYTSVIFIFCLIL